MRVVQLVFHLGAGGAEKFVTDLSNELSRQGHQVTVLMIRDASIPEFSYNLSFLSPAVRVRSLGLPTGFHPRQIPVVCKAVEDEHPEVVHCHLGVTPYIYRLSRKRKDIRFIHTIHSIPSFDIVHPLLRRMASRYYKRTITPVAISRTCCKLFEESYGFRAETIENGRDIPEKSGRFDEVSAMVDKMKHPVFVHVARYAPEKNQRMLIESFKSLAEEGQPFTLLLIGDGYGSDIRESADHDIRFLGPCDNVCDYLRLADAFCLSSRVEGSPISLIEALGCGSTPVCTPAMISDGETGYLSAGFSREDYLAAIRRFIAAPIGRECLVRHYKERFTMERCASRYLELYQKDAL